MAGVKIEGKITLDDGSQSEFALYPGADGNWIQWGAGRERLGRTVEYVQAMQDGLLEAGLMEEPDDDEPEQQEDIPTFTWEERAQLLQLRCTGTTTENKQCKNPALTYGNFRPIPGGLFAPSTYEVASLDGSRRYTGAQYFAARRTQLRCHNHVVLE